MARITKKKVDKRIELKNDGEKAKVLYSFRIKEVYLQRLREEALKNKTSVTELLETMVEQYLGE